MGHKVHPIGFRLGISREWQAKWFADRPKRYRELLLEDMRIRKAIAEKAAEGAISRVDIERSAHEVVVGIHTARPGIIIGRGGQRVEELRKLLERVTGKRVRLNIQEVRSPELDAYLVARNIGDQLERRVSHRRAMKQAVGRTLAAGAKGIKINVAGRLAGSEIARREKVHEGRVPLHTLRADIDFGRAEARTPLGRIGVKVWINRGEILPEPKQPKPARAAAAPAKAPEEAKPADVTA